MAKLLVLWDISGTDPYKKREIYKDANYYGDFDYTPEDKLCQIKR